MGMYSSGSWNRLRKLLSSRKRKRSTSDPSVLGKKKCSFDARVKSVNSHRVSSFQIASIINHEAERKKKRHLSAIVFADAEDVEEFERQRTQMDSSFTFEPIVGFPYQHSVLVMGSYIGQPVKNWIETTCSGFWINKNGVPRRAGQNLAKVGRNIATMLNMCHTYGHYFGDLLEGLFVNGDSSIKITKFKKHSNEIEGIRDDLMQFRTFVELVQNKTRIALFEGLALFYELFPQSAADYPTTLPDMKEKSYIVCHAPLFWGEAERNVFAAIYWKTRNLMSAAKFDSLINLEVGSTDVGKWWLNVPPTGILRDVYRGMPNVVIPKLYSTEFGIIPFHRNCYVHYPLHYKGQVSKGYQKVDKALLKLFPTAYPKAYVALFIHCKHNFIAPFQEGGLNYKKAN